MYGGYSSYYPNRGGYLYESFKVTILILTPACQRRSLSEFSYCKGGSASGDLFLVGHLNSATVREGRVEDWLRDRYRSAGHVAEFEYELVEFFSRLEDYVSGYRLVLSVPDIDGYPRPVARNILYPGITHHRIYLVEVDKVPNNVVHQPVKRVRGYFDLVVLDNPLNQFSDVRCGVLVGSQLLDVYI